MIFHSICILLSIRLLPWNDNVAVGFLVAEYSHPKLASSATAVRSLPIPKRRSGGLAILLASDTAGTREKALLPHQGIENISVKNCDVSRRGWLVSMSSLVLLSSFPQVTAAAAAPPLTAETADNVAARVERAFRPKPARVLRPRLNLDFAVLLMRSSYNAVDDLDIVAMDQFQRDFFLIRQAEYKTYADSLGAGAMQQGDLADPNYFDFISFAQYATILREIVNPPLVFEEQQPVDVGEGEPQRFNTVVVKRNPSVSNNDLPRKFDDIVGNAILDKLIEKFGDTASALPKLEAGSRPGAIEVLAAIQQMVNLFVISGFAWSGNASMQAKSIDSDNGAVDTQFSITFTSPATLWSGSSLQAKRKEVVTNDFALKTVRAMMSRAGYSVMNESVKYANYQELSTFTIK